MSSSLIDFTNTTPNFVQEIFRITESLMDDPTQFKVFQNQSICLLFFEPSTRTRVSFQTAAIRMGLSPILMEGVENTSLVKGETIEDTLLNIEQMDPRAIVVRCGDDFDLKSYALNSKIPIINAGWGKYSHPTQALLDAFTIYKELGEIQTKKILITGDIKHSRVAQSQIELFEKLGAEVQFATHQSYLPETQKTKNNLELKQGLQWADVVVSLRTQLERHTHSSEASLKDFQINSSNIQELSKKAILLHPGPVNWGSELTADVKQDSRVQILKQVHYGVYVREALLRWVCQGF